MARPKNKIPVKIKRLDHQAVIPSYATDGSAAFDLVATGRHIKQGSVIYSTGLSFELPEDHVMLVFSRSGHGFNDDLRLSNCVGVIDADYRGEVKVKMTYDGALTQPQWPLIGDRVAQAIVLPIRQVEFEETDTLSDTERGQGGMGSTGK